MAAADPCNAEVLLMSISFKGTQLGVAVGASLDETVQDVTIRGEGKIGPTCRIPVAADLVCTCQFLVKPFFDPLAAAAKTPGNLVITTHHKTADVVTTLTNMVPRGFSHVINRDAPPFIWSQTFVQEDSMDTQTVS